MHEYLLKVHKTIEREDLTDTKVIRFLICSRAQAEVSKALASGELVRLPCKVCGNPVVQAHHCNYTEPIEVMWLCAQHHTLWHKSYVPYYPLLTR